MIRKIQNRKKSLVIYFIIQYSIFNIQYLFSQSHDTLKTEDIEIINIYEPVISDAFKVLETPRIIDTIPPPINVKYDLLKRQIKTEFHIDTIKAATMKSEPLPKLYNTHIKLGAGNHLLTLADVSFHNLRSRDYSYGARLNHFGAGNNIGIDTLGKFSGFSENSLKIYGTGFLENHSLSGELEHSRNVIHFYGFNPDSFSTLNENATATRQRFQKTNGNVRLMSFYKDSSQINYDLSLNYYNLQDLFHAQENNFLFTGNFYRFYGKEQFQLSTAFDFNDLKNIYNSTTNAILKIHPQIISEGMKWRLNAGLGIFSDMDNSARFFFKPIAEFKFNVVDDLIIPYAGIRGKIARNNFKTYSDENPFLLSAFTTSSALQNSNNLEAYLGIRGRESSELSFNVAGSINQVYNMPMFVIDTNYLPQNKFTVVYDNVSLSNVHAEATYEKNEKLKILFSGDYFSYDASNELKAWYKPQWKGNISAFYNLQNKIILRSDIFGIANQYAKVYDADGMPASKTLKGIIDANLSVEYKYNHRLAAFLNLNNLGGVRYYRWQNYPAMRFNVLGGISYSF